MIRGKNWEGYLSNFPPNDPRVEAFTNTATNFYDRVVSKFDHQSRVNGLLYGEVQSGKTSQTFALIAATADADEGFRTFVYFSTDNVPLQEQTFSRGLQHLSETFEIVNESDELRFRNIRSSKPCLVVLKKNTRVLQKWLEILSNSARVSTGPVFLIDDEGDAASPNTKVNKDDESEIYKKINAFRDLGTSSILLQVTATPQALFLQQEVENLRPGFLEFFEPGQNYLGGDFYFSKIDTARNIFVEEDDLEKSLKQGNFENSTALFRCFASFAVTSALFVKRGNTNANALVHPSVNTGVHHQIAEVAKRFYRWIFSDITNPSAIAYIQSAVDDLRRTLEEPFDIDDVVSAIENGMQINVVEMNSTQHADRDVDTSVGFNLVVGGNTLGRGVTFPALQTVYYTRQAKVPQADTYWQHSRMFGYDRDKTSIRIFMPLELFILFQVLQESNKTLANLVKTGDLKNLQIVLPRGVKPTRSNVVRSSIYSLLVGGTNYFPAAPNQKNASELDALLKPYSDSEVQAIDMSLAKSLVALASNATDWPSNQLKKAMENMEAKGLGARILIGRDRNTGRTGTMLTEQDRKVGEMVGEKDFVITAYRVHGGLDKGWQGNPFWLVNVRIPSGYVYHQVN